MGNLIDTIRFALLFPVLFFCLQTPAVAEAPQNSIFFYNPETNINNLVSLKFVFDNYLAKSGKYQFQPFDNKEVFESTIRNGHEGVYLLSSWHFQALHKQFAIKPVLIGVADGKVTQKKILSVNTRIKDFSMLRGRVVAVAGNIQYSKNILRHILGSKNRKILDSFKILLVPKDIDALMSVGFGMADAALTSEKSLEKLKKINFKLYRMLNRLGTSQEKFLTIAAISRQATQQSYKLLDILEKMAKGGKTGDELKMLGLDGWRKLTDSEIDVLQSLKEEEF